jgi:putative tricarboxylic transport membrane protein
MSDERDPHAHLHTRDILAEIEAEVAHEIEEERPLAGGPIYQTVGALVALAVGVSGAVLAYGYGLGSLPARVCGPSWSAW